MPKFFVSENQIRDNQIFILGEDVNHIKNVLRTKIGKKIEVCNLNNQKDYQCEIVKMEKKQITCDILQELEKNVESNIEVTIYQGLPKAEKMEWIIQKSVELGVKKIIPTEMTRCVVKINEKDKNKKTQRWQKIAEVAAKQCGRNYIPTIGEIEKVKNICQEIEKYDIVLVAYENERKNTLKEELRKIKDLEKSELKIAIVIGSEGGIAPEEIELLKQSKAKTITLGKRILRTETVALHMLSIIMYELEK